MEREVGRGIGMGNTCKSMADSFQCMTKFTTNKKQSRSLKMKKKMDILGRNMAHLGANFHSCFQDICFLIPSPVELNASLPPAFLPSCSIRNLLPEVSPKKSVFWVSQFVRCC